MGSARLLQPVKSGSEPEKKLREGDGSCDYITTKPSAECRPSAFFRIWQFGSLVWLPCLLRPVQHCIAAYHSNVAASLGPTPSTILVASSIASDPGPLIKQLRS